MTVVKNCKICDAWIDWDYKTNQWLDHKTQNRHVEPDLNSIQRNPLADLINENSNDLSKQVISLSEDVAKLKKANWESFQSVNSKLDSILRKL
jgi:hypothetical protein